MVQEGFVDLGWRVRSREFGETWGFAGGDEPFCRPDVVGGCPC